MKAVLIKSLGLIHDSDILEFADDFARPSRKKGQLLVRVLTCATSAGDMHVMSGRVSFAISPPSFPYIPGSSICGIVEEADAEAEFKPGDRVIGHMGMKPWGALAEYAVVEATNCVLAPDSLSDEVASACGDSAATALKAVELAGVKAGSRVLVLGGSGGVGSVCVQLARVAGATFVASTSTQVKMLTEELKVDRAINYKEEDWWSIGEFQEQPFDCIVDCVGGGGHFGKAQESKVLKSGGDGGKFIAVVGDEPEPTIHNPFQLAGFASRLLWRALWTWLWPWSPRYIAFVTDADSTTIKTILRHVTEDKLLLKIDPSGPYAFTKEGVTSALKLQESHRAHGKVVIRVSKRS
mmetsp:Transcript_43338/g.137026  ORF Transcript_43338/g.137026 Transcript_43338/m.137026 type:complete len:352 (-) Transcript_43338:94-1149(-)